MPPDLVFALATFARRGLLRPGRPGRVLRQIVTLRTWGYTLAGELRASAARFPERVAVVDSRGPITYDGLVHRTDRLAAALAEQYGVGDGDRVGILARNHCGMVEAMVAVAVLGADQVLLNTGMSAAQIATVAREQRLRLLCHDDEFAGVVPPDLVALAMSAVPKVIASTPEREARRPDRDGRTVILTSGTTGAPRGARRPVPPGMATLASIISRIPLGGGERMLISAPLFHTWGYAALQMAFALSATAFLEPQFDPPSTLRWLVDGRATAWFAVPVMIQRLLDLAPPEATSLRVVAASGSALPGGLATRFMDAYGDVLYNLYGSTEASWASIATPADLRVAPGTAGRPPHGTRLAILDDAGRPMPAGGIGRIFVHNAMLFDGYTSGPGREIRDGMLATGDLGHVDRAGLLYVDGREDDMIVSGGENVYPGEVEDAIARLDQVRDVAVVGVADAEFGQRLAAYVVLANGAALGAEDVRDQVRSSLARQCVPRDVVFVDALPRNATGKVVTRELPGRG